MLKVPAQSKLAREVRSEAKRRATKVFALRVCQMRIRPNFAFERDLWGRGVTPIAGVDEVGVGAGKRLERSSPGGSGPGRR